MADLAHLTIIPDTYADVRFKALTRIVKSERLAMGYLIEAFFLSQKYWRRSKSLIPLDVWEVSDLEAMVESRLAERTADGVYIKGAEKYFRWIYELDEKRSVAGKKSAASRREKYGTAQPANPRTHLEQTRTPLEQTLEHRRTPSKVSISISTSIKNLNTGKPPRSSGAPLATEWLNFGQQWLEFSLRHTKSKKTPPSWTAENFGKELAKVSRSTGSSLSELSDLVKWAETDDFWPDKITSPSGLLSKSKNGNRKVDNLLAAYHKSKTTDKKPTEYTTDWGLGS